MVTAYSIRFSAFPVSKIQILFNSAKFIFKTCGKVLRGGEIDVVVFYNNVQYNNLLKIICIFTL